MGTMSSKYVGRVEGAFFAILSSVLCADGVCESSLQSAHLPRNVGTIPEMDGLGECEPRCRRRVARLRDRRIVAWRLLHASTKGADVQK